MQATQGNAPGDELPGTQVHGDRKILVHRAGDFFLQPGRSRGAAQDVPVKREQEQENTANLPREIRPEDNDAVNLVSFSSRLKGLDYLTKIQSAERLFGVSRELVQRPALAAKLVLIRPLFVHTGR